MLAAVPVPPSPSPAPRLRWPLPALLAWGGAWLAHAVASGAGAGPTLAAAAGLAASAAALPLADSPMRRACLLAGYPLSLAATGALGSLPAWAWLAPLALLATLYPLRSWRDAPLFPTPAGALDALATRAPLPDGARVLDAGCGLGHGLAALRRAYPGVRLEGVEWSLPLAALARLRRPDARIRRGDLWAASWTGLDLVYVFQRPESMPRVQAKAAAELAPGAWLASLAFPLPGIVPQALLPAGPHALYLYRAPLPAQPAPAEGVTGCTVRRPRGRSRAPAPR